VSQHPTLPSPTTRPRTPPTHSTRRDATCTRGQGPRRPLRPTPSHRTRQPARRQQQQQDIQHLSEIIDTLNDRFALSILESCFVELADLEDWLDAGVGQSGCCSVCGDNYCRTLEVRGTTIETIPERLIVKAALRAAAEFLDVSA
jgi:hypothetical protein